MRAPSTVRSTTGYYLSVGSFSFPKESRVRIFKRKTKTEIVMKGDTFERMIAWYLERKAKAAE